jgi:enoyl-CoA hydratase/carnithine racemase
MTGIEIEQGGHGAVTVWLANPGHYNALTNDMIVGLVAAFARLAEDPGCRVVVLRGRGGVFCAGRELRDVKELQSAPRSEVERMYRAMEAMNHAIYDAPQPVVAVVEKFAFGIASMLVSWSDIAIAEDNAQLGYPEVQHGITPYGAVPTMLNTMSQKALLDLLLTGRKVSAAEALRLGLLSRCVPAAKLESELHDVLADLARGSAEAIRRSKRFVRECESHSYREGIAAATAKAIENIGSADLAKGLAAFVDKKKPDWS